MTETDAATPDEAAALHLPDHANFDGGQGSAAGERACPAAALERSFQRVLLGPMAGLPMLNGALHVEAVGFRPWADAWLGVLITPWFMNLMCLPRVDATWQALAERAKRVHTFPAGAFEFIGARDADIGDYQSCSLFSPMFEFADQAAARDTARSILDRLFEDRRPGPPQPMPAPASKRAFLFGHWRRGPA